MSDLTSQDDPFAPENVGGIQAIVLMRIYDALIAILQNSNPDMAKDLLEAHMNGILMGPSPYMTGQFVTDEANNEN